MKHHTQDPTCPLCEEKLLTAHERLQNWFLDVKKQFPDLHVSCGWRGREDQNIAFVEGKTRATYPHSKHNHEDWGQPCSLALDLFQLNDGVALFKPRYFGEIHRFNQQCGYPIQWGGKFRTIRDAVHFELKEET